MFLKLFRLYLIGIVLSFIFTLMNGDIGWAKYADSDITSDFQKGMCYATWNETSYASARSDESLKAMAEVGTNCVQIVVTWYQEDINSLAMKYVDGRTPSDESVAHAIKKAHEFGMAVMLKPHVDLLKDEGNWRGDIGFSDENDWERWFSSYKKFIKHYAEMAQENKVEFFCVGTELSYAVTKVDYWTNSIIPMVRETFKGRITYAANWDDYKQVQFWPQLDYVGIDAYFPLADKNNPTLEELMKGWEKWVAEIEAWQSTVNMKIIFTECGYCSADSAAKRPWEEIFAQKANVQIQQDCYRALFETFCDRPWFAGLYWWSWNTYAGSGGMNHSRFTPQNKPAVDIVKNWYREIL